MYVPEATECDEYHRDVSCLSRAVILGRLRSLGLSRDDLGKPLVAIANTANDIALPHKGLTAISAAVKLGIAEAGGIGLEFGTITVCDGIAQGTHGMKYVLPSREIISDSIEVMVASHGIFSGLVCIGGCDKSLPGMLLAAARLGLPSIMLSAGPIVPVIKHGIIDEDLERRSWPSDASKDGVEGLVTEDAIKQAFLKGMISHAQAVEYYSDVLSTCGVCTSAATANTMGCASEALGMSLPHSNLTPLVVNEKLVHAKKVGRAIMRCIQRGLTPSTVITRKSLRNAVVLVCALGGSANAVLHLLALAESCGIEFSLKDVAEITASVPRVVDVMPLGELDIVEFYKAGGVPAALRQVSKHVCREAMTVSGETLGDIIDKSHILNTSVIRSGEGSGSLSDALVILKGNLAPEGAMTRPTQQILMHDFVGEALVFNSEEEFYAYAKSNRIPEQSMIVVRNEGPVGGPGMPEGHRISEVLRSIDDSSICLVTDARMSGATVGLVVGYVSPESAIGGPLSIVENGDVIRISVKKRELSLLLDDATMRQRFQERAREGKCAEKSSFLRRYQMLAQGAEKGCSLRSPAATKIEATTL